MNRIRRIRRMQQQVRGSQQRPRLVVNVSNRHVRAQIIDDEAGRTLACSTSEVLNSGGSLADKATQVGGDVAAKAQQANVTRVRLDRRDKPYHGRVAALATAAREQGLEF